LTGPNHSGVELHGFLSYLIRCNLEEREYTIFGYKGKQVRDNIHSYDVARAIEVFYEHPSSGAVSNIGGGRDNSVSILEAFDRAEQRRGLKMRYKYTEQPPVRGYICCLSAVSNMKTSVSRWDITKCRSYASYESSATRH